MNFDTQLQAYFAARKYTWALHSATPTADDFKKTSLYMTIPLQSSSIEIPAFALNAFSSLVSSGLPDGMVVPLFSKSYSTYYKSFAKIIEIVLTDYFPHTRLMRVEGRDADRRIVYYATQGALFDSSFHPLMMCTWQLRQKPAEVDNNTANLWWFTTPIMRLTPEFYLQRPDNVWRFVCKKVLPALLHTRVEVPIRHYNNSHFGQEWGTYFTPKVEIAPCPFPVKAASMPSISTTNDSLCATVLQNIDDLNHYPHA